MRVMGEGKPRSPWFLAWRAGYTMMPNPHGVHIRQGVSNPLWTGTGEQGSDITPWLWGAHRMGHGWDTEVRWVQGVETQGGGRCQEQTSEPRKCHRNRASFHLPSDLIHQWLKAARIKKDGGNRSRRIQALRCAGTEASCVVPTAVGMHMHSGDMAEGGAFLCCFPLCQPPGKQALLMPCP